MCHQFKTGSLWQFWPLRCVTIGRVFEWIRSLPEGVFSEGFSLFKRVKSVFSEGFRLLRVS